MKRRILIFISGFWLFTCSFYLGAEMPKLHAFGDSHAQYSFAAIEGSIIHWLGPITMHRVGRDGINFLNLKASGVKENDTVIFSFGEIDVRCHIAKQCAAGRKVDEVIDTLVKKYIAAIDANRVQFSKLHCIIFAVVPPAHNLAVTYPTAGTIDERVYYTIALNKKLAEEASLRGIYLLDIFRDYAALNGTLRTELSDGSVHIQCKAFLRERIASILNIIYKR